MASNISSSVALARIPFGVCHFTFKPRLMISLHMSIVKGLFKVKFSSSKWNSVMLYFFTQCSISSTMFFALLALHFRFQILEVQNVQMNGQPLVARIGVQRS